MYKITFGRGKERGVEFSRGVEFVSKVNKDIIKGLWGHRGTKVKDLGYDEEGNEIYSITDFWIRVNPLLVTCERQKEEGL